jgi:hypothetical protein
MTSFLNMLRAHKFESHLTAFLLMIFSSGGLYFAAERGSTGGIWGLMCLFVLANIIALVVK